MMPAPDLREMVKILPSCPFDLLESWEVTPAYTSEVHVGRGAEQETFVSSVGHLVFFSGYFRSILGFQPKPYAFEDFFLSTEEPSVYGLFNRWIQTNAFLPDRHDHELDFESIVGLYIFGIKFTVPKLMNVAVNAFVQKIKFQAVLPSDQCVDHLWKHTPRRAGMRVALVTIVRSLYRPHRLLYYHEKWRHVDLDSSTATDALHAVLQGVGRHHLRIFVGQKIWRETQACKYHVHPVDVYCERWAEVDVGRDTSLLLDQLSLDRVRNDVHASPRQHRNPDLLEVYGWEHRLHAYI